MSLSLRRSLVLSVSAGALAVLPALMTGGSSLAPLAGAVAHAAGNGGDHGGGNGGGHGGEGGGGHGEGADHGNAGGGMGHGGGLGASGSHGQSDQHGAGFDGVKSIGGFVSGLFGSHHGRNGTDHGRAASSRSAASRGTKSLAREQETALRGKSVPVPTEVAAVTDRNLHAKLGWLNSLQRNYQAYLNAKDPKFAPIQDYVLTTAKAEVSLDQATAAQSAAVASYNSLTTYDAKTIDPTDMTAVAGRISDLQAAEPQLTGTELDEAKAELGALQSIAAANEQVSTANAALAAAPTLDDALKTATNSDQVDPEVESWADGVLSGKIGDVKTSLESQPAPGGTATTDGADTQSVDANAADTETGDVNTGDTETGDTSTDTTASVTVSQ